MAYQKDVLLSEIHLKFIEEKSSNTVVAPYFLTGLFAKIEEYEKVLGEPDYAWTSSDLLDFYVYSGYKNLDTLNNAHCIMREYYYWCERNGLIKGKHNICDEIRETALNRCVNKLDISLSMPSYEDVIGIVSILSSYRDKFLFLALYEGMDFDEIAGAKTTDIDKFRKEIVLNGRKIPISSDLIRFAFEAANEKYIEPLEKAGAYARKDILCGDPETIFKRSTRLKNDSLQNRARNAYFRFYSILKWYDSESKIGALSLKEAGRRDLIMRQKRDMSLKDYFTHKDMVSVMENQYGYVIPRRYIAKYGWMYS